MDYHLTLIRLTMITEQRQWWQFWQGYGETGILYTLIRLYICTTNVETNLILSTKVEMQILHFQGSVLPDIDEQWFFNTACR